MARGGDPERGRRPLGCLVLGLGLLVGVLEEVPRCQVPSAIARTRRGGALVCCQSGSQESVHFTAGLERRLKRCKQQPEKARPGCGEGAEARDGRRQDSQMG